MSHRKSFLFDLLDHMSDVVITHRPTCLDESDESCYGANLDLPCVHCVPLIKFHDLLLAVEASDAAQAIERQAEEGQNRLDRLVVTLDRLVTRMEATEKALPDEREVELAQLRSVLHLAGGRGVEVAERIDTLEAELEEEKS